MKKKNKKGGKLIIVTGIISIIVMTVCAFGKKDITRKYYEYKINKNNALITENEYFIDDNFNYVENYKNTGIKSKDDLINYVYYALNSGNEHSERYIDKSYVNYSKDIDYLTKNNGKKFKEQISILNNFVHPYNSSDNVKLLYGSEYTFGITIKKVYTEEEIKEINKVIDEVISEKTNNSMPIREKIRVIHDYIIDNTEYDKLKNDNINDTTYKSQTAYGALIQGYATCNGYSDAMAIFLDKLNVINYKISNDEHIWNLVYLDGKWYHLELTWDDPISEINVNRDTYFLITSDKVLELNDGTHEFDKNIYSEAS